MGPNPGMGAAGVNVAVQIEVKGFIRTVEVQTDATGDFTTTWQPLSNEAGLYSIAADHPSVVATEAAERPIYTGWHVS